MKTKEEILEAKSAKEVLKWIQANPDEFDAEVGEYFNELARQEFRDRIGPTFDPDTHYDFKSPRKKKTDGQDS